MYRFNSDEIIEQIETKVAAGENVRDSVVDCVREINKEWREIAKRYCNNVEDYSVIYEEIKQIENIIDTISLFYSQTMLARIKNVFNSLNDDIKNKRTNDIIDKLAEINSIKKEALSYIEDIDLIEKLKANKNAFMINNEVIDVGQKLRDGINSNSVNYPYHMRGHAEIIIEAINEELKKLPMFKFNYIEK